jgi:endoglucanase Acf2
MRRSEFLLGFFLCAKIGAQVPVGAGSYLNNGNFVGPEGTAWVTDDFRQKPMSAQWWATLITTQYSGELYAHPASFKATAKGLEMGNPGTPTFAGRGFNSQHKAHLTIGIEGLNSDAARVAGYSHFSVTARWTNANKVMEATIGHGLPFAYFRLTGGNAVITFAGTVWSNQNGTLGITVGDKNYGVFAPSGSTWSGTGTMTSDLGGKDYLSIAALPDGKPETLAFFRRYAFSFVKKTAVNWQYQESLARMISTFSVETEAKEGTERGTIFSLLRHQWLNVASPLTGYTYASARGEMKVAEGASFATSMLFNGILPALPNLGQDMNMLKTLVSQAGGTVSGGDSYGSGKSMGKLAAQAQIAEFAGNPTKRAEIIKSLEAGLEAWLSSGNQQLYYNKTWGTLIGYPASFGSDSRLADHHFHYGYFIMAAAIIAQWDPAWAKQDKWGGMVEMLIREVNSWDENDPLFGRFKYFDAYEGHGWADGAGFARGNNQESSSESMNCNAGIILYGINTGNKVIRDLGIFMYVNEARAIEEYWFDVNHAVFPTGYTHNAVGMVWTNGGEYATWFSSDVARIHGINFLPITSGSLYLARNPEHILKNYQEGFGGSWDDIFYEYLAFSDPEAAVAKYGNGVGSEGGESKAHTYYHLQSLKVVGRLNTEIGASLPSFAVFDKAALRTYTAFNPNDAALLVTFTDGFSMDVPAHTQISKQGELKPISIRLNGKASGPKIIGGGSYPWQFNSLKYGDRLFDLTGSAISKGTP